MIAVESNGAVPVAPSAPPHSKSVVHATHSSSSKKICFLVKPNLVPTTSKADLPHVFHEPYVDTGYRQIHQPWTYYVCSIFQCHNECLNVWTHLIALIILIFRFWNFSYEFDMLRDPYMWPLGAEFLSAFLLYTFSSGAHCFSSKSELAHYTCFIVDYAGIGLHGLGSTVAHYYYCMHEDMFGSFPHRVGPAVGIFLSSMVCLCCSVSKIYYSRPYPFTRRLWQIGSCLLIYTWFIFPVTYQLYLYLFHAYWEPSLNDHVQQILWFFCGGFFFSSDIPQRFFPGRFDFVGHGHQIFHVCVMMTSLKQLDAIHKDIIADKEKLYASDAPTFLSTYGAIITSLLINLGMVLIFHQVVKYKIAKCKKLDKQE